MQLKCLIRKDFEGAYTKRFSTKLANILIKIEDQSIFYLTNQKWRNIQITNFPKIT